MPVITRDGVCIRYDVHAGPPAATPLLLTHGYAASRAMWERNIAALTVRRTVVTWDMRGHGDSDSPDDPAAYSHDACVGDMAAVLDAAGFESAAVGGLSLGGYLSLEFYLAHPSRVQCLLLFDTGPGFTNDDARQRWNDRAHAMAAAFDAGDLSRLSSSGEVRRDSNPTGLAHAARGMLAQRDDRVIRSLPQVAVPTLVVVGADDEAFLAAADYMAAKVPGAEKVVVPAAGHAVNIDQPVAFAAAVTDFLDRHAGAGA